MKTKLVDGFLNLQLGHSFWGQTASIPSRQHEKINLGQYVHLVTSHEMKTKLVDGFLNLQLGHRFWGQTASIPSRHHEKNDLGPICPFGDVTRHENEARRWFSEFAARTPFLGSNSKYSISAPRKKRFGANMSIW